MSIRAVPHRRRAAALLVAVLLPVAAPAWARTGTPFSDRLTGGSHADVLHGDGGDDRIRGGAGSDLLTGDVGSDRVDGGAGDDVITGASGPDALRGGTGDDVITGGFGPDGITGGAGDDVLDGQNDDDVLLGGAGADVIHGGSGTDRIDGGPGDDLIFNDSGRDTIKGGAGDDQIVVDPLGRTGVDCGPGDDTIVVVLGDEPSSSRSYYAGAGCEHRVVTRATVDPNRGVTQLAPDAGTTLNGGPRDDTLLGGPGPDLLRGVGGHDVLWGMRQPDPKPTSVDVLDGGDGEDTLYGGPGRQRLIGGRGDDFIEGGLGANRIDAGTGKDVVRLRGTGPDRVSLGAGDDTLKATVTSRATVHCGAGRDTVTGGPDVRAARDCERVVRLRRARRRGGPRAAAATVYADAVRATPGLRRYWRLDEPAGSTTAVDTVAGARATIAGTGGLGAGGVTDDGHTGWALGTPHTWPADGHTAVPLDGIGDTVTVELWVLADDSGSAKLLALGDDADPGRVRVTTSTWDVSVFRRNPAGGDFGLWRGLDGRHWHHVVVTAGPQRLAVTVDGVRSEQALPAGLPGGPWTRLALGPDDAWKDHGVWTSEFNGSIDEVAVYAGEPPAETFEAHRLAGRSDGPPAVTFTAPPPARTGTGYVPVAFNATPGSSTLCAIDDAQPSPCRSPDFPFFFTQGTHTYSVRAVDRYGRAGTPVTAQVEIVPTGIVLAGVMGRDDDDVAHVAFAGMGAMECTFTAPGDAAAWHACTSPVTVPANAYVQVRERDGSFDYSGRPALGFRAFTAFSRGDTLSGRPSAFRFVGWTAKRCVLDGGAAHECSEEVPDLSAGDHLLEVGGAASPTGSYSSNEKPAMLAVRLPFQVGPRPGDPLLLAPQYGSALEAGALARRAPRLRFLLAADAAVAIEVADARGRRLATHHVAGRTGGNVVKLPGRVVRTLRHGRYVMTVRATRNGRTDVARLPFAVIPRRR